MSNPKKYYVYNPRDARAGINSQCILWWKPNRFGYTRDLRLAGKYSEEDRKELSREALIFVPCKAAEAVSVTEMLVFLDKLPIKHRPKKGRQ